ncbi:MAG: protein-disulfide reductase DsbD domain-containing protein [Pseudomonadota bacterium]|nr:protein-disulfide reductase DsbD domain-containing protein [Pseudomonadota bacterium]
MSETKKYTFQRHWEIIKILAQTLLAIFVLLNTTYSAYGSSQSNWAENDFAKFRIISGVESIANLEEIPLGLEFELIDGWKVYWRNPGDAGFPPSFIETESNNLQNIDWLWPVPMRFTLDGMQSFGYEDRIIIPLKAKIKDRKRPLYLRTKLSALACKEICVPIEGLLTLQLPAGTGAPSMFAADLKNYEQRVPNSNSWPGFTLQNSHLNKKLLTLNINSLEKLTEPDVFIESKSNIRFGKPAVTLYNERHSGELKVPIETLDESFSAEIPLTLTFVDRERFVELNEIIRFGTISQDISTQPFKRDSFPLTILIIAFFGGVILNLMPCVLPVLMIKLLDITRAVGEDRKSVRLGFLSSALGIISSFLLLAIIAILFKKLGVFVTWGMQFQQPIFITISSIAILGFAAGLLGWLKFEAPNRLLNRLSRPADNKYNESDLVRLSRHFFTGVFATILATPCSAPLVGTALTFALGGDTQEIIFIFLSMGLGLALPYLSISIFPFALAIMPKPGAWMRKLEIFLAMLLCLTAVWLLTVLAEQISLTLLLLVIGSMTLATLSIVISKIFKPHLFICLAAILGLCAIVLSSGLEFLPQQKREFLAEAKTAIGNSNPSWVVFDEQKISKYVNEGHTVLVDVSAEWCITCKVNEKLFISNGLISDSLKSGTLIGMKADWTKPDNKIANYLFSFNRYGIPFTVIYGPRARTGIVLPELLDEDTIRDAIEAASYYQ